MSVQERHLTMLLYVDVKMRFKNRNLIIIVIRRRRRKFEIRDLKRNKKWSTVLINDKLKMYNNLTPVLNAFQIAILLHESAHHVIREA